jgi:hypothetical protein
MGRLPFELEEKRQRLVRAARRGAFESYVRHGRVPDVYSRIAEATEEAKNLNAGVSLGPAADARPPGGHPTNHYTWRTAGDDRVRGTHAALNGRIFSWANPPEHGHPGSEANCRCWSEPYYGDPAVPDALLQLVPERRVNTDPGVLWASIETLTRPDGSIAASVVRMHDGTNIGSTFVGSIVEHAVTLPSRDKIRLLTDGGVQSVYAGSDVSLFQSRWTAQGPQVVQTRQELAFLLDGPPDPGPVGNTPSAEPGLDPLEPKPLTPFVINGLALTLGLVVTAAIALDEMRRAQPEAMGTGATDVPVIGYRIWTTGQQLDPDGRPVVVPVFADAITAEQAVRACPLLPEVQAWTDMAALNLAATMPNATGKGYGLALHEKVKREVLARKETNPLLYRGVTAEYSMDARGLEVTYRSKGSRRLDVIDRIPPETPRVVCDFEIKTGGAKMEGRQLMDYIARLAVAYPGATIFLFQISPYRPPR